MSKQDFISVKTAKIEKYQLQKYKLAMISESECWLISKVIVDFMIWLDLEKWQRLVQLKPELKNRDLDSQSLDF